MDQETLVEMQIKDGQRLLDRLVEEGAPVWLEGWREGRQGGVQGAFRILKLGISRMAVYCTLLHALGRPRETFNLAARSRGDPAKYRALPELRR